jgi:hypothetical protein
MCQQSKKEDLNMTESIRVCNVLGSALSMASTGDGGIGKFLFNLQISL